MNLSRSRRRVPGAVGWPRCRGAGPRASASRPVVVGAFLLDELDASVGRSFGSHPAPLAHAAAADPSVQLYRPRRAASAPRYRGRRGSRSRTRSDRRCRHGTRWRPATCRRARLRPCARARLREGIPSPSPWSRGLVEVGLGRAEDAREAEIDPAVRRADNASSESAVTPMICAPFAGRDTSSARPARACARDVRGVCCTRGDLIERADRRARGGGMCLSGRGLRPRGRMPA